MPMPLPLIRTTFEVVTPESAEAGDADRRGWTDETGYDCTPDAEEGETVAGNAIRFLTRNGACHASTVPGWHPGVCYSTDPDPNYGNGEDTTYSYHLDGFTEEDSRAIHAAVTTRR